MYQCTGRFVMPTRQYLHAYLIDDISDNAMKETSVNKCHYVHITHMAYLITYMLLQCQILN